MEENKCISCKVNVVNDKGKVSFKCPKCSNHSIIRCSKCRSNATKFTCPKCNFEGPN